MALAEAHEEDGNMYSTFIRLAFTPYTIHFKSPRYMSDEIMRKIDTRVVKWTLKLTGAKGYIRNSIGTTRLFWEELTLLFSTAIISLERRSFGQWDPSSVDYETTSSALIASVYPGLYKDVGRLNYLVMIARNVLIAGEKVQDLCAECEFDQQIFKLINCCVRVTAPGYDGEPGHPDEEKWQATVNEFKKLLITCVQFLNNLCARNERRKLILWGTLFDVGDVLPAQIFDGSKISRKGRRNEHNLEQRFKHDIRRSFSEGDADRMASKLASPELQDSGRFDNTTTFKNGSQTSIQGYAMFVRWMKDKVNQESIGEIGPEELGREMARRWIQLSDKERQLWKLRDMNATNSGGKLVKKDQAVDNFEMRLTANMAIKALEIAKADLMDRVAPMDYAVPGDFAEIQRLLEEEEKAKLHQEVDSSDDSSSSCSADYSIDEHGNRVKEMPTEGYHGNSEDGRGLLTDVPLILGPSEIEVLPNLIMSGLIPQPDSNFTDDQLNALIDMHTVRCHLLLSHENGRNLLRELLIFVAAWDLREEELYFKFMVKIMEAILVSGLMPYAYHAFRDQNTIRAKDIISPAQAVIMKLLTNIFRYSAESNKTYLLETGNTPQPTAAEIHTVNYIFTELRQHIIPQTCSLIHLQGKIHDGTATNEQFPMNLWDMERMYEGVYQYLEFFAVLTEEQTWKDVMAKWEVASELVTILKELERAIPKLNPGPQISVNTEKSAKGKTVVQKIAAAPTGKGDENTSFQEDAHDEPSDFEWRNLKKLTVLVLSSLIWKNKLVQDQVREFGGLEALVGCCRHDEHNPYIREHAIMCLRFAVEGNAANAAAIRSMADGYIRRATPALEVPKEVLDTQGYETFMDGKGQVGLRRKESHHDQSTSAALQAAAAQAIHGALASTALLKTELGKKMSTKMAVERAAELMQTALESLPMAAALDKDSREVIAKLNKAAMEHVDLLGPELLDMKDHR